MDIQKYRSNKIKNLNKYEIKAIAKNVIDYVEVNKFRLLF